MWLVKIRQNILDGMLTVSCGFGTSASVEIRRSLYFSLIFHRIDFVRSEVTPSATILTNYLLAVIPPRVR